MYVVHGSDRGKLRCTTIQGEVYQATRSTYAASNNIYLRFFADEMPVIVTQPKHCLKLPHHFVMIHPGTT